MRVIESIEIHKNLNEKIFDKTGVMHEDVHQKILEIVSRFIEDLDVPPNIADIQLVGSNASFNYTEWSDLDVHIVSNFDLISLDRAVVQALYNSERQRFNSKYDIKIRGLKVELYVEDIKSGTASNGIYSIINNAWVKYPTKIKSSLSQDTSLAVSKLVPQINNALVSDSVEVVESLINQLYLMRKNSIAVDGEYGEGNQIFKDIRNLGLLDALKQKRDELISKDLSLESLSSIHEAMSKMKLYL